MNHVCICSSSIHQDSYFIYQFWIHLCWVQDQWKQVIFSQIIQMTAEFIVGLWLVHQRSSQTNLVIIMSAHQIFDLDYQISIWSWNQIIIYIQLIIFISVLTILWWWSTADSYNQSAFILEILILWVQIIITQSII